MGPPNRVRRAGGIGTQATGVESMSRQTSVQRWCTLVLLAAFSSLILSFGLPALAYRIGRSFEEGRHDEIIDSQLESLVETANRQRELVRRAVLQVEPAVVRV